MGGFLSEIIVSNADLAAAPAAARAGCSPNWTTDQIGVHALQVFGTLFSCRAGGNPANPRATGCAIEDALGKQCVAPAGVDLFNVEVEYECVTICDNPGDPCPQPPAELPFP
jgi:hypothetical protein